MSDSENDTIVIPFGESLDQTSPARVVVGNAPRPPPPPLKTLKVAHDDDEEEESSDEADTPSEEEGEEIVEGMEKEAKKLFLGEKHGDNEEHEWVDRVSNLYPLSADPELNNYHSDACGNEHAGISHHRQRERTLQICCPREDGTSPKGPLHEGQPRSDPQSHCSKSVASNTPAESLQGPFGHELSRIQAYVP